MKTITGNQPSNGLPFVTNYLIPVNLTTFIWIALSYVPAMRIKRFVIFLLAIMYSNILPAQTDKKSPFMLQLSHKFSLLRETPQLMTVFENQGYYDIGEVTGFEDEADSYHAYKPLYLGLPISLSILYQPSKSYSFGLEFGRSAYDIIDVAERDSLTEISYFYSNYHLSPYALLSIISKPNIYLKSGVVINFHDSGAQLWSVDGHFTSSQMRTTLGYQLGAFVVLKSTSKIKWALSIEYLYGGKIKPKDLPTQFQNRTIAIHAINVGNTIYFKLPAKKDN